MYRDIDIEIERDRVRYRDKETGTKIDIETNTFSKYQSSTGGANGCFAQTGCPGCPG